MFGTNANYPSVLANKLPTLECNFTSKDVKDHLALLHSARQEFLKAERQYQNNEGTEVPRQSSVAQARIKW